MQLYTLGDLAIFLGGSETSFTGMLLQLIAKADPGNLARIHMGFPYEVTAWKTWMRLDPAPTAPELAAALQEEGYS